MRGDRDRPRERLWELGVEPLTDAELMALVIGTGGSAGTARDVARGLLTEHGGLAELARARPEELAARAGIGPAKAAAILAAIALGRRAAHSRDPVPSVRRPEDVARLVAADLAGLRRERVVVLVCDGANRPRRTVVVSEGAEDRALFPVREILNAVLRHDGRAFALAHNHPSGDPEPSEADGRATAMIGDAARTVGVRFLGHVVVATGGWRVAEPATGGR